MLTPEYHARKMTAREFRGEACYAKRTADGRRAHFAVEDSSGASIVGLGWQQALDLADHLNREHADQLEAA